MSTRYKDQNTCCLARIVLEAETPLKIGSGSYNIKTDSVVIRDENGLPYIPATTLMGLTRHSLTDIPDRDGVDNTERRKAGNETARRIMGYQDYDDGRGSFLAVTDGKLIGEDGKAVDGLRSENRVSGDDFLQRFLAMPIRQHVRIGHRGTTGDGGKFDEEVVPKGARFVFEMELRGDSMRAPEDFDLLLDTIQEDTFRIGGGSRKGFGKIKVVAISARQLSLTNPDDFKAYMEKTSCLSDDWEYFNRVTPNSKTDSKKDGVIHYRLELHPVDFLMFSSGFGDDRADMTVVMEPFIEWSADGKPSWVESENNIVIPASSVKGAIAHRTAYYFNKLNRIWADDLANAEERKKVTESNNLAVYDLFGSEGKSRIEKDTKRRGRVIFSDIVQKKETASQKVINHVKIDRFTGGAIDGAFFAEDTLYARGETFGFDVFVMPDRKIENGSDSFGDGSLIIPAFEEALKDICLGLLPLGGGVNRGNGCFRGELTKDDIKVPLESCAVRGTNKSIA